MRRESSFFGSATFWIIAVTVAVYFVQRQFAQYLVMPNGYGLTVNFENIPPFLEFMLNKFAGGVSPVNQPVGLIDYFFGMNPFAVVSNFEVWRLFSYIFLHADNSPTHLIFNMLILFMCGFPVEAEWGKKRFLIYYFLCGIGAGIIITIVGLFSNGLVPQLPTIGASGALFGILFAFAKLNPESMFLIFFIVPVKAKHFIVIYALLELFYELTGAQPGISHIGHLGGLVTGFAYFRVMQYRFSRKKRKNRRTRKPAFSAVLDENRDSNMIMKNTIREKLKSGQGKDSLTDDEWQYLKYLDIIHDDSSSHGSLLDREFLEEVKSYIKL